MPIAPLLQKIAAALHAAPERELLDMLSGEIEDNVYTALLQFIFIANEVLVTDVLVTIAKPYSLLSRIYMTR